MKEYQYLFFGLLYFMYFLYACLFAGFGIFHLDEYINLLHFITQLFLSLILIIRFHPFQKNVTMDHNDNRLVFSCATFLLASLGIDNLYTNFRQLL
jgi:hypothetical protein